MENNIVNVYGYIRVSTEGQVKQGYSLAEQRAEIEKYCSSKSYNLIEIFKDEGISGAKANEDEMSIERNGLLDMLASLKENKIQYIVVLSTNRLWRSDLVKVLLHTYCTNMAKSGISVKTLQYLMGHADIATTMNVYTHLKLEDAKDELEQMKVREQLKKEMTLADMEYAKKEIKRVSSI